jgi:hypothetical protein
MKSLQTGAPSTPNVSSSQENKHEIGIAPLYTGLYTRVARQLGLDPSYVRRVALGERKSLRVAAAISAELQRIQQNQSPSADSSSSSKLRISLRCVLVCTNGEIFARIKGTGLLTLIGKNDQLAALFPPSRFVTAIGSEQEAAN